MVCAWEEWREHVKIQNLLERIISRFRQFGKSRTFNTWIANVKYRRYARDLANRVFKRLDNRGLSEAWTQWQLYLRYDRYMSDMNQLQNQHNEAVMKMKHEADNEVLRLKQQIAAQENEKKKIL